MDSEARKYLDTAIGRLPKKLQVVFILRTLKIYPSGIRLRRWIYRKLP